MRSLILLFTIILETHTFLDQNLFTNMKNTFNELGLNFRRALCSMEGEVKRRKLPLLCLCLCTVAVKLLSFRRAKRENSENRGTSGQSVH